MQSSKHLIRRRAFTLVEIMVVVAIIAMLSAILSANILRARKRAHAAKILDDLRMLDGALDQWAVERNKKAGDIAEFSDLQPYLKQQNKLNLTGYDIFGQPYGPYSVDTGPKVAESTFSALSDVAPADFWSPFR
jgi:prepilin-type N-terminal cleavage/methylation domain-containing protein